MAFIHTNLFRLIFPLFLTLVLFAGISDVSLLVQANAELALKLPYILFAVCMLLCQGFSQGRIGMLAITMALAYWVIQTRMQSALSTGTTGIEFILLAFTYPAACISVYLFPEKRFFTFISALYLLVVAFLIGWSLLTIDHVAENGISETWESILFVLPQYSPLPFVIVLYNVFLVCLFGIFVLQRGQSIDVAVYSCLCIGALTFIFFEQSYISSILFSLGGILLIVGIISTSHELAYLDELTGIPGRRALETELRHLGRKYTIAMLDVDHFKKFNDTYGHDTGDDVLRLVASLMSDINGKAKVYRYGGEEFTIVFKNRYKDQAKEYLEELREAIADYEMVLRNLDARPKNNKAGVKQRGKGSKSNVVSVTVSIGVADSLDIRKPLKVVKAADEALYRAKKAGRNRVSA